MSDLEREHYTESHLKWLRKELKTTPVVIRTGTVICPYCKHLEARWRSEPTPGPGEAAGAIVRVRCSQCQLTAVLTIP